MRTWSVRGTAFALCTRSSSLSMRTSTSMAPRILLLWTQRGSAAPVRKELPEAHGDRLRHQLFHVSPEDGDLLHAARRDERHLRARHHEHRLDVGREVPVELVHLELPLEVGGDAEALHDRLRLPPAGELDDQLCEHVDLDVRQVPERLAEELDPLLD